MVSPLLAQHNCPTGFDFGGTLKGSGAFEDAFDARREIKLPSYATIDTSYQQSKVRSHAGNDRAKSDLQAKNIPKGILTSSLFSAINSHETMAAGRWHLSSNTESGEPALRYLFGMKLYCISSSSPGYMHYGGCDVNVYVCYKPKKWK